MPGPPKTPSAILKARGSWRGDLNPNEPKPQKSRPDMPDWLRPEAAEYWERLCPILENMRVLTVADREILARYCQTLAKFRETEEFIAKYGSFWPEKNKKNKIVGFKMLPQAVHSRLLCDQLLRIERELGLTPSSRTQISAAPLVGELTRSRFFKPIDVQSKTVEKGA